jgi:hypothetical protein
VCPLISLNLSDNQITDSGGEIIAQAVKYNRKLVRLNLEGNELG